jgi:hypothetical protein
LAVSRRSLSRYQLFPTLGYYPPRVGQWMHAAFTFDGTATTMYINGGPFAPYKGFSLGPAPQAQIVIGASWRGGGQSFNGFLDDVRIYNRALTPAEVWALAAPGR